MEGEGEVVSRPGFRFYPTEEELITFYLKHKLLQIQQQQAVKGTNTSRLVQDIDRVIPQLHVYDFNPWDLPQYAGKGCRGDPEQWFFFVPRQEKELRQGGRPSRLTTSGYWKGTGSPAIVYSSSTDHQPIGIKRSMVFYNGRAPTGNKTKWKMNEYKAFALPFQHDSSANTNPKPTQMQEVSLCRVYIKSNCPRAFDRRPSGFVKCEPRQAPRILYNNEHHSTASTNSNRQSIAKSTTTTFYYNTSHSLEVFKDQPLWEWEENLYRL